MQLNTSNHTEAQHDTQRRGHCNAYSALLGILVREANICLNLLNLQNKDPHTTTHAVVKLFVNG